MAGSAGSFITPLNGNGSPATAAALLGSECAAGRAANLPASVTDTQDSIIPCQSKIKWLCTRWGPGSGGGRGAQEEAGAAPPTWPSKGGRVGWGAGFLGPPASASRCGWAGGRAGCCLLEADRARGSLGSAVRTPHLPAWRRPTPTWCDGPISQAQDPGAGSPALGLGCGGLMEAPLGLGAWTPGQCDRVRGAHGSCRGAPTPHPRLAHHAARRHPPPSRACPSTNGPHGAPLGS